MAKNKILKKNKKEILYEDKLNLFKLKLQELTTVVQIYNPTNSTSDIQLVDIIDELDLDNTEYYTISYFYNGLNKISRILEGSQNDIHYMLWIIICTTYERFLKFSDPKIFTYFEKLYSGKYYYKIFSKGHGTTQKVLELLADEKSFITEKLAFLINSKKINDITESITNPDGKFITMCDNLASKEKSINSMLEKYQNRADEIAKFIKEQQTKLNFVGLGNAFKQITKEKNTVKNNLESYLFITFIILIVIPLSTAIAIFCCGKPNYYICIPLVTIELLLLYAFRLFYQQYMFIKSELLQVNLRHSLCAFIESYMEFKKNNKDNTVDLFEQLIFSNIISDEKKVPATVDGLDSIANIIQAIKGRS